MKITNGKDFWAGVMFLLLGLGFAYASKNYNMGTAVRMGPAYFPTVLGGILAVLGAIILVRAFVSKYEHPLRVFPFRLWGLVGCVVVGAIAYWGADFLMGIHELVHKAVVTIALGLFFLAWGPKSLFVILLATVAYGYLLKPLGMAIATVILIVWATAGGREFRPVETLISAVVLTVASVLMFITGLGLPFNIWPQFN